MGSGQQQRPFATIIHLMKIVTTLLALLLIATHVTAADRELEIIPLKHRLLNDVLPVVKPLVEPGGTVTGSNNQLIVKSSPANIAEIKQVLEQIDNAPRQLMITVKHSQNVNQQQNAQGISGRYDDDEITVQTDGSLKREDLLARIEDKQAELSYEQRHRTSQSDDRNTYRIQATEGYPAHIQAGVSLPYPTRDVYVAPGNVIVQDGYQYQDATSGFYVLPRLQGDTVTLEVAPRMVQVQHAHGPPIKKLQDVKTVISGQLGEWLPIGGVNQSSARTDTGVLNRRSSQDRDSSRILIRVEEVNR